MTFTTLIHVPFWTVNNFQGRQVFLLFCYKVISMELMSCPNISQYANQKYWCLNILFLLTCHRVSDLKLELTWGIT